MKKLPVFLFFLCFSLLDGCFFFDRNDNITGYCNSDSDCAEDQFCSGFIPNDRYGTCLFGSANDADTSFIDDTDDVDSTVRCSQDSDCPNNFICNENSRCYETCSTNRECVEGFICDRRSDCVQYIYSYLAIISETTNQTDIEETNNPGPDIDSIELIHQGTSYFATEVVQSSQGFGPENRHRTPNAILVGNDAIPNTSGSCSLEEDPNSKFWSMGDHTGFAIVIFDRVITDGDLIRILELNDLLCDNIDVEQDDQYGIYIGKAETDVSEITSSSNIAGDNWFFQGSSSGIGGIMEISFSDPDY